MFKEFKEFAVKGNMVDMAVGLVLGAAFGTIISSLVADILMPIVSSVFSLPDFSQLYMALKETTEAKAGMGLEDFRKAGGVALAWGNFINALISFFLVALALFFVVKGINKVKKAQEEEAAGPSEVDLLTEIRDALKK